MTDYNRDDAQDKILDKHEIRLGDLEKTLLVLGEQVKTLFKRVTAVEDRYKWFGQSITYILLSGIMSVVTAIIVMLVRG